MKSPRLVLGQPAAAFRELSDEAFVAAIAWNRPAPAELASAARRSDLPEFDRQLQRRLKSLFRRTAKQPVSGGEGSVLSAWSRPAEAGEVAPRLLALLAKLDATSKQTPKHLRPIGVSPRRPALLARNQKQRPTLDFVRWERTLDKTVEALARDQGLSPFELLVLCEVLMRAGTQLSPVVLRRVWRTALEGAAELCADPASGSWSFATSCAPAGAAAHPEERLFVFGELRVLTGLLFADVRGARELLAEGRTLVVRELLDQTDTDGAPKAELLERLPVWLVPLVRSVHWSRELGQPLLDAVSAQRFRKLLTISAQICRADGRPALSNGFERDIASLLTWASPLAGWKKNSAALGYLVAIGRQAVGPNGALKRRSVPRSAARPTLQSDWARVACLRSDWSTRADALVLAHHGPKPLVDLTALGEPLLEGVWDLELSLAGKPLPLADRWTCTCWFSDKDADYLEIQLLFDDGPQVERQVLLSRREHFVLLADVVLSGGTERVEYASSLPLVSTFKVEPDRLSRECRLSGGRTRARAFPLALPSERVHSAPGSFGAGSEGLQLRQSGAGGLYAPVVIDWHPERRRDYADWRMLTVTELQRVVRADTASAHRLRIGDLQLFVYRSVAKSHAIPRAALGHHTANETVVGRLDKEGTVVPIVLVE